jgi:formamidopyrimidine-DNA glycosylase
MMELVEAKILANQVNRTISGKRVKDLFGQYGKYQTKLSKKTLGTPCPRCKNIIQKEAYLGGSIYYCSECQA